MSDFMSNFYFLWVLFAYAAVVGMGLALGVVCMVILLNVFKKKSAEAGE